MAKKKRSAKGQFVAGRATRAKRVKRRRNPDAAPAASTVAVGATPNPPMMEDLAELILPGFGGYAATKFLHRIISVQLTKRYPNAGKHVAAASTIGSFLAAWLLAHRVKRLAEYHTPIVIGSAIASIQTLVQTYFPRYGWMVSDVQPDALPAASAAVSAAQMAAPVERLFPGGPEIVDNSTVEDDLEDLNQLNLGSLSASLDGEDAFADGLN